jgi:hypothetical protein
MTQTMAAKGPTEDIAFAFNTEKPRLRMIRGK